HEILGLPASGAAVTGTDGVGAAIYADSIAVVRFRNDQFDTLSIPAATRDGATAVALDAGKVGIVCGPGDAIAIDVATDAPATVPNPPTEPRMDCAAAATPHHLVIAGGTSLMTSQLAATAEIFDAATLAPIATAPLVVPRRNANAIALANGQIMI